MAIMIPERPKDNDPRSDEVRMFEALRNLPDDYYVFHSFQIGQVYENYYKEAEMDFLIFHPLKILCPGKCVTRHKPVFRLKTLVGISDEIPDGDPCRQLQRPHSL